MSIPRSCLFLFILCSFIVTSCDRNKVKDSKSIAALEQQFELLKVTLIEKIWRLNPDWATSAGYHKYDSELIIPTPERINQEVASYQSMLHDLHQINSAGLTSNN